MTVTVPMAVVEQMHPTVADSGGNVGDMDITVTTSFMSGETMFYARIDGNCNECGGRYCFLDEDGTHRCRGHTPGVVVAPMESSTNFHMFADEEEEFHEEFNEIHLCYDGRRTGARYNGEMGVLSLSGPSVERSFALFLEERRVENWFENGQEEYVDMVTVAEVGRFASEPLHRLKIGRESLPFPVYIEELEGGEKYRAHAPENAAEKVKDFIMGTVEYGELE